MTLNRMMMWLVFGAFILLMLFVDLFVLHRKAQKIKVQEAFFWSVVWVGVALGFNAGVYFFFGPHKAVNFFTGYLIERALSMDNVFVFLLIFNYFKVPVIYQHSVLFWGIFGALVIRAVFIVAGITLIEKFHWMMYVFGLFLVVTGIKLAFEKDKEIHPEHNPVLKVFKRFMPVTHEYHDGNFFIKQKGRSLATPLFIALLVVETTDVIFALDSIPAILAITVDPFIVYTSNVFAILGLRALYFALAGMMEMFHYLHYGLAVILVFIGGKMLLDPIYQIPMMVALGVITGVLAVSILTSIIRLKLIEIG